jgi:hypothetical protein
MLSVEHLFLGGLGFDIAGAYLVSRGLLQPLPQLATQGGTWYSVEQPQAPYAVEDRIRGTVGLVSLVVGFTLQAVGYGLVLAKSEIEYGTTAAIVGLLIALAVAVIVPVGERLVRPAWRDRILVKLARFDFDTGGQDLRLRPVAHVLRAFGTATGRPKCDEEDDVCYCLRVFEVDAEDRS